MTNQLKTRLATLHRGEVPEGWHIEKLGKVSTMFSGGTPATGNQQYYNGDIPFIRSAEIDCEMSELSITQDGYKASSAKMVIIGDLLYALYGANSGDCALSKQNGAINQAILCIRPQDDCKFVYYFLYNLKSKIISTYLQGGQGNLSAGILKSINIYRPPLPEQQKIATILSTQDKLIGLKEELIAQKQRQKQYLMQRLLTGENYSVVRLREIASPLTQRNNCGNCNVLTISAQYGLINQEEFFKKEIASENKEGYFLLEQDDFAYNKSYSNGYPLGAIKRLTKYENGIVSPLYICFRVKSEKVSLDYLECYFEAGLMNREIQAFAQEGARNHGLLNIAKGDFYNSKLYLPPFAEQQAIANILTTADREINLLQQELEQEKQKKKALMQLLLTGIVRVTP